MIELLFFYLGGSFVIAFYQWIYEEKNKDDGITGIFSAILFWPIAFLVVAGIRIINKDNGK